MISIKMILTGLATASLCMADISGIVTDTGSTPITGAVVQLENSGQTVTTGADGLFTLVLNTAILPGESLLSPTHNLSARILNGLLCVNVAKKTAVEITTFDLAGKTLSMVRQTMDAGTNSTMLPFWGAGIYLYKVKSGNQIVVLKGNSMGGVSSGRAAVYQNSPSKLLAKQTKTTFAIFDVLAASKIGYLNYRMAMYNFDTTGIQIKMIANAGTVTDADGNMYQTVKIGSQEWMAENLRVTHFNDGKTMKFSVSDDDWSSIYGASACYFNNDVSNVVKYGVLYNWYAASSDEFAPEGWHVPTNADWDTLQNYLITNGYNWDGTTTGNKIGKSLAVAIPWGSNGNIKAGDLSYDVTTNNKSGFSAVPVGLRSPVGNFHAEGFAYYWSSTQDSVIYYSGIKYDTDSLSRANFKQAVDPRVSDFKAVGLSVRLVKD